MYFFSRTFARSFACMRAGREQKLFRCRASMNFFLAAPRKPTQYYFFNTQHSRSGKSEMAFTDRFFVSLGLAKETFRHHDIGTRKQTKKLLITSETTEREGQSERRWKVRKIHTQRVSVYVSFFANIVSVCELSSSADLFA